MDPPTWHRPDSADIRDQTFDLEAAKRPARRKSAAPPSGARP